MLGFSLAVGKLCAVESAPGNCHCTPWCSDDRYNCNHGSKMNDSHTGCCLCGEVRFEIDGGFDAFYLCHCERCRKDTGSAHAANLFSSTARLKWICGEGSVTSFTLPSTGHSRSFCAVCGSALPGLQMGGALLVVPAGSLDSEVPLRPDAHIFVSSRAGWDRRLDRVPMVETLPT